MRIVVPAFRAECFLPRCLEALVQACAMLDEKVTITVVDDGENGDIAATTSRFGAELVGGGPSGSAGAARNRGFDSGPSKIVVFVDADVEVQRDAIAKLIEPIRAGRAEATFGNYSGDTAGQTFAQAYKHLYVSHIHGRRHGELRNQFWTALSAVRSDTFAAVGKFDTDFLGACDEDTELGFRLTRAHSRVLAVPEALGKHLKEYTCRGVVLNDLHKGTSAIRIASENSVRLTDYAHCWPVDILAVVCASALPVLAAGLLAAGAPLWLALGCAAACAGLYLGARQGLLRTLARPGWLFALRAVALMWVLDLVRGICVLRTLPVLAQRAGRIPREVANYARAGARLMSPGAHMPVYALVFVTSRCDARCGHCFYWRDLNGVKGELTVEEYGRLARSLGPLFQVTLTGGSPELRNELVEIAAAFHRFCRPVNMTICMLGRHTRRVVEQVTSILQLREGMPLTVSLSLDGIGDEHDALRCMPGLFDHVRETFAALEELKRESPQLSLSSSIVVSEGNYQNAASTAQWARANLPIDVLKPILIRGEPKVAELRGPHCLDAYVDLVERERPRLREHRTSLLSRMVHAKENVQRELIGRIARSGEVPAACSAGRQTAVIYPDGKVAGCEMRPDVLGDLRDTDMQFGPLWFGAEARSFRASRGKAAQCRGCVHHCFISPVVFRSPRYWPALARHMCA